MASENTTKLTVVTPYKTFYEGRVNSVVVPTLDGQIGFMPGHVPLIVALKPGIAHFIIDNQTTHFTVSEGFCEVDETHVLVVCNAAELPDDLSPRRTCKSYSEAAAALAKADEIEDKTAREVYIKENEQSIERAKARRRLLELYGSDHKKERIAILVREYGWEDEE